MSSLSSFLLLLASSEKRFPTVLSLGSKCCPENQCCPTDMEWGVLTCGIRIALLVTPGEKKGAGEINFNIFRFSISHAKTNQLKIKSAWSTNTFSFFSFPMLNLRSSRASQYRSATHCDQWPVKANRGQWDGLVGKSACHQTYWPEVNPGIHLVEGENQLLHIVLWPPNTCMWRLEDRSRCYYFGTESFVESGAHWLIRLAGC